MGNYPRKNQTLHSRVWKWRVNWLGRVGGLVLVSGVGGGVKEVFIGGHLKFGHFQNKSCNESYVNFDIVCGHSCFVY